MTSIIQQFKERIPDLEESDKPDKSKSMEAAWKAISEKEITKSIDLMPSRLCAVLKRQGQAVDDLLSSPERVPRIQRKVNKIFMFLFLMANT